jgi:NAD(P)-dependent dehydrogenase (short-subunit alcohol dehydrogenase family)
MSLRLDGKIAIVTGSGTGIGAATARRFAQEGARVVLADLDAASAHAVCAEIVVAGGEAVAGLRVSNLENAGSDKDASKA